MTHLALPLGAPIGPAAPSAARRVIDAAPRPLILVLAATPTLAEELAELSAFLHADIHDVPSLEALETALQTLRPVGLVAHTPEAHPITWAALRVVSRIDPGLPVLLVTGATQCGATTPAETLTNVFWLDNQPGLRAVSEFLFRAERRPTASGPTGIAR